MRSIIISLVVGFCMCIGIAEAQNISDEAMRHFDRGQAAVEIAESTTDYEDAIKEFEKAAKLAPEWPDVYYNLGLIQEKVGKDDDAIRNLTKYLELSPNASDSREVKKFVAKIEYKLEKAKAEYDKIKDFLGEWDCFERGRETSYGRFWVFTLESGVLICRPALASPVTVSPQVDGKKLKTGKLINDQEMMHTELEFHIELITKTLMRGYCNSKVVWVRDSEFADLLGRTDRSTIELRKR
jgi:tetratricopeptide (TPR) repeat protein